MPKNGQQTRARRSAANSGLPHEDAPRVQVSGDFEGLTDAQLAGAMPRGTVQVSSKPPLGTAEQPLAVRDYAWRYHQHGRKYSLLVQFVLFVASLGPEAELLHLQRQHWDELYDMHCNADPSAGEVPFDLEQIKTLSAEAKQPDQPSEEEEQGGEGKGDGNKEE